MSKLYAVALALLVLAVPAMAAPAFDGPWKENVDLNIVVNKMAELWHASDATLDLTISDAGSHFGKILNMNMLANTDFHVTLRIADDADFPENVLLNVVVNADTSKYASMTDDYGAGLRRYNATKHGGSDMMSQFQRDGLSSTISYTGTAVERKVWDYTRTDTCRTQTISNIYSIYAGGVMAQQEAGHAVTVEYIITPE